MFFSNQKEKEAACSLFAANLNLKTFQTDSYSIFLKQGNILVIFESRCLTGQALFLIRKTQFDFKSVELFQKYVQLGVKSVEFDLKNNRFDKTVLYN